MSVYRKGERRIRVATQKKRILKSGSINLRLSERNVLLGIGLIYN